MIKTSYKRLLSEKSYLKVKLRAMRLSGTFIDEIFYNDKTLLFRTRSGTDARLVWYQTLRIEDLQTLEMLSQVKDLDKVIRDSHLKVHCFTGDTEVLTSKGYVQIKDIKIGDLVFTHLGRLKKVVRTYVNSTKEIVKVRVGTSKNDVIKCTPNHKFLLKSGEWVEASSLKLLDKLESPILKLEELNTKSDNFAFILGLYLADGSLASRVVKSNRKSNYRCDPIRCNGYNVGSLSLALHKDYLDRYREMFGDLIVKEDYPTPNGCHVYIYDKSLREFCLKYGGVTNKELSLSKHLSDEVLSWSDSNKKNILKGFFLGDGTILGGSGNSNDAKSAYCVFYNTNKQIMDMLYILLKQYVDCHYYFGERNSFEQEGRIINPKTMYKIGISTSDYQWIKENILNEICDCKGHYSSDLETSRNKTNNNVVRELVLLNESVDVYNLEVEEDNSYIVKGVAVHNCTCLIGSTLITTKNGLKRIDRVTNKDFVLSSDGRYHRVFNVLMSRHKEYYKMVLSNSQELIATGDHKVRYFNGNKVSVCSVSHLEKGSLLLEPRLSCLRLDSTTMEDCYHKVEILSYDKITSSKESFYDICLADDPHDYIASGVVVKNCPAFLYWGFAYKAWKEGYGIVKETRAPRVRNPHGQGYACFVGNSRILTETGYRPISSVIVGDRVFTKEGRLRLVTDVSCRIVNETVSLRVESKWVESSLNHPSLSYMNPVKSVNSERINSDLISWNEAGLLRERDFLFGTKLNLEEIKTVGAKKAYILGLYLSDGNLPSRELKNVSGLRESKDMRGFYSINISVNRNSVDSYKNILSSKGISIGRVIDDGVHTPTLSIKERDLIRFCLDNGNYTKLLNGNEKKTSVDILSWTKNDKIEFLKGFFLGNGTFVEGAGTKEKRSSYITFFNTNESIINTVFILLKSMFDVTLESYDRKDFIQNGRVIKCKKMFYVRLTGNDASVMAEILKDELPCKGGWSQEKIMTKTKKFKVGKLIPLCIKERKLNSYPGGVEVFNLSVDEDDSYIIEGTIQHNCKHLYQCAMVYPFLAKTIASKMRRYYEPIDKKKIEEQKRRLGPNGGQK